MFASFLSQEFKKNMLTQLLALFALPVFKAFKKRLDPRRYNGAAFLGINGIVVKVMAVQMLIHLSMLYYSLRRSKK